METMGQRIEQKRKEKGMTMDELGAYLGVKASAINKYEKGLVQNIKRANIQKLAELFECSPTWLMGLENDSINDYEQITYRIELFYKTRDFNFQGINLDEFKQEVLAELHSMFNLNENRVSDIDVRMACNRIFTRMNKSKYAANNIEWDNSMIVGGLATQTDEQKKACELYKKYKEAPESVQNAINSLLGLEG